MSATLSAAVLLGSNHPTHALLKSKAILLALEGQGFHNFRLYFGFDNWFTKATATRVWYELPTHVPCKQIKWGVFLHHVSFYHFSLKYVNA
jgi:hypothetical protein